ncbi:MAG TPA: trigger factor [Candidatus Saccharimonadales bacterium]|nr:trigger factor [Candidatus Saccharimonadales bacterium]
MKHVVKKPSDTQVTVTVTLDAADLAPIQQKTIARLAKSVKVAGFRPGKVPTEVAAKQLDANYVNNEVLEDAVNASAIEAFDAEKLVPLDRPKVDVTKYVPGQEVEYTATVEIIPQVKLGDYKKLKATKDKVAITDKEIDEVIERLQTSMATKQDVERAAKNGDEVIIDFDGKDKDGKAVAGASGKDYPLTLGSNSFIPGFEEGLVGKKAGDAFELPLTFPKDYHHKPLAGAKVTFTGKVTTVKEVVKPETNDAFAAKAGPFKTVAELKADIKRELTDQKEREAVDALKDSLVEQLVKGSHVPVPEVLVEDQLAGIERDFVQNLMYRGMTLDQYLEQQSQTKEEWRDKELKPQAERRVQVGLALAELSKVENIEVSKEELDERLSEMLQRYGNTPEVVKQLDTPETRRDIANRLVTEKTVNRLVDLNNTK